MFYETPELFTDRLILKRGNFEDYKKVYEYDFTKLRNIMGEFVYEKCDSSKIVGFDEVYENSYDWIVYLKDNMNPIANIVADREQNNINAIELSFNTHPNYWMKGYNIEALYEIIRFLFENRYENLLCSYDEGNFKSKKLCEKIGFIPYGVKKVLGIKMVLQ